ncbi:MAG: porin family protein [Balneolaceae bacterium]
MNLEAVKYQVWVIMMVALFTSNAVAQQVWTGNEGVSIGIRAGFDLQNITGNNQEGNDAGNQLMPAYNAGLIIELPLTRYFYLQSGLLYNTKGAERERPFIGPETSSVRTSYLELPINFLFKPILGNGNLMIGFGSYAAIGTGGEAEYETGGRTEIRQVKFQNTVEPSDPEDVVYFRPYDAGANFLAGYEFRNRVSLQLNAQFGLIEINPEREDVPNDESALRNTGFGVSLGFRF